MPCTCYACMQIEQAKEDKSNICFKILDKDGVEMQDHYSGRRRTYEEAKNMLDRLNKNGEYRPYTMVEV